MITLSSLSRTPIYQQIIDQVLAQIAGGVLSPHSQMPAVRALAKDLGINPNTVVKAYNELEHAGYLYAKAGVGYFVCERNENDQSISKMRLDECRKELHLLKNLGIQKKDLIKLLDEVYEEVK